MCRRTLWLCALVTTLFMLAIPVGKVAGIASSQVSTEPPQSNTTAAYQINLPQVVNQAPDERSILMALYRSTNGGNWPHRSGWNTSMPYCTWYGVICDGNQHVTSLILEGNSLAGPIPPELGGLLYLTVLKLDHNQEIGKDYTYGLSGSIPPQLGDLVNLQSLDLSSNLLNGLIPPGIIRVSFAISIFYPYLQTSTSQIPFRPSSVTW